MVTETKNETWQYSGRVISVNEKGLKLDGWKDGEEWLNFTREEWRSHWYTPQRGEEITVQCVSDKNGRMWIKSIILQGHQDWSEPEAPPTGAPTTNRDLSIVRQVALKCATEVAVALIAAGRYQDEPDFAATKQLAVDIPALAQDLERWAARAE